MACPSRECNAGSWAQRQLTAGEKLELPLEQWVFTARVCCRCGCVHTIEANGDPRIRGFRDHTFHGCGWRPAESEVEA
jgi:hypothetical protein